MPDLADVNNPPTPPPPTDLDRLEGFLDGAGLSPMPGEKPLAGIEPRRQYARIPWDSGRVDVVLPLSTGGKFDRLAAFFSFNSAGKLFARGIMEI